MNSIFPFIGLKYPNRSHKISKSYLILEIFASAVDNRQLTLAKSDLIYPESLYYLNNRFPIPPIKDSMISFGILFYSPAN